MKRSSIWMAVIGAVIVVLIIVGATVWMSDGARNATDRAVERVSEFYLEELAERRTQVVSRYFETIADQMERAVALMEPEDLASQEALRSFIGKVEDLYGLDLFAVADEDQIVYTEFTTYTGGSRYAFLADEQMKEREITTIATYGGGKGICLAVPVKDRVFRGKELKTCFVEIKMNEIASVLAFDTEENGTRFSLYYENGENLTGRDFGPVGARQNLLNEMSQYLNGEEHKTLSDHFSNGISGEVHFISSGNEQVLYYSPIPDTNWMITILIRKNLIYDQIGGIRDETMNRSRIQILVTCVSLLAFFGILALKARGRLKAQLEAERKIAVKDALTGVGNKYAYTRKEAQVNSDIRAGSVEPFAVIVCDLNGLKQVNDTQGHAAGDDLIQKASRLLCECYKHSPVFRIGGDEFVAFLQGQDYEHREELLAELNRQAEQNIRTGEPVLAAGMAEYGNEDWKMHDTFERADQRMYIRKKEMKTMQEKNRIKPDSGK